MSIAFWSAVLAAMLPSLYPPGPEREIIAQTFANPALISMLGPGYGLDNYHMGAIRPSDAAVYRSNRGRDEHHPDPFATQGVTKNRRASK